MGGSLAKHKIFKPLVTPRPAMTRNCISCHKLVTNTKATTSFKCPQCQKYDILRCGDCRKNAVQYVCPGCGFAGPN